jgi:hypothetical protein
MFSDLEVAGFAIPAPVFTFLRPVFLFVEKFTLLTLVQITNHLCHCEILTCY